MLHSSSAMFPLVQGFIMNSNVIDNTHVYCCLCTQCAKFNSKSCYKRLTNRAGFKHSWHKYKINLGALFTRCRFQWPRGLRRRTMEARLLRMWFRIPQRAWMFVCCECCVLLSGRGLCDKLITRPEEFYRMCCVVVWDLETSWIRRPWPIEGSRAKKKLTRTSALTIQTEQCKIWISYTVCLTQN
jgi:hypothetical protein